MRLHKQYSVRQLNVVSVTKVIQNDALSAALQKPSTTRRKMVKNTVGVGVGTVLMLTCLTLRQNVAN